MNYYRAIFRLKYYILEGYFRQKNEILEGYLQIDKQNFRGLSSDRKMKF